VYVDADPVTMELTFSKQRADLLACERRNWRLNLEKRPISVTPCGNAVSTNAGCECRGHIITAAHERRDGEEINHEEESSN